jgi:hypothetical protein
MVQYFQAKPSNVEALRKIGKRCSNASSFLAMRSELKAGEVLIGAYDRGLFWICPVLNDQKEFDEFESQYDHGLLLAREFYIINKNNLSNEN